jgi:hypothetical protein
MPSGDASRVWFPEMLDALKQQWNSSLSWEACAELCEHMTEARAKLRQDKGLKWPLMRCQRCNALHEMRLGPITIRSMLFALRKLGVLTGQELTQMDAAWRRYRAQHRLDGSGQPRTAPGRASNSDAVSTHPCQ